MELGTMSGCNSRSDGITAVKKCSTGLIKTNIVTVVWIQTRQDRLAALPHSTYLNQPWQLGYCSGSPPSRYILASVAGSNPLAYIKGDPRLSDISPSVLLCIPSWSYRTLKEPRLLVVRFCMMAWHLSRNRDDCISPSDNPRGCCQIIPQAAVRSWVSHNDLGQKSLTLKCALKAKYESLHQASHQSSITGLISVLPFEWIIC